MLQWMRNCLFGREVFCNIVAGGLAFVPDFTFLRVQLGLGFQVPAQQGCWRGIHAVYDDSACWPMFLVGHHVPDDESWGDQSPPYEVGGVRLGFCLQLCGEKAMLSAVRPLLSAARGVDL